MDVLLNEDVYDNYTTSSNPRLTEQENEFRTAVNICTTRAICGTKSKLFLMDYLYPLITLITLLVLFHLAFIKFFPQNKRFWKKVDYWWVSLGVIGIIGATFTYRKEISSAWQPWHKQSLQAVYGQYQDDIRRQSIFCSDTSAYFLSIPENSPHKRKINTAGTFFSALSKRVDSCKEFILNEDQYDLVDSVTAPYQVFMDTIKDQSIIDLYGLNTFWPARLHEEASILTDLRAKENRDTLNWILLVLSPYLFAIAIAIRLTKVTAELKESK
jgi:hypothetical protein